MRRRRRAQERRSSSSGGDKSKPAITVGSANFPENVLLGEIYAGALTAKKFNVSKKLNIGARAAVFSGLERGDLTVVPEYTGSLLGYVSKGKGTGKDAADQVNQLKSSLPRQADAARAVDGGGQGHGHLQQGDREQVQPQEHRGPQVLRPADHHGRGTRVQEP